MTPPSASPPYKSPPLPRSTSVRSIAACGTLSQNTHPPNASFGGIPSASTSDRLGDVPPMPRSAAPCAVGFALRDEVRRNSVKPGIAYNASSMVAGPLLRSSLDEITVTVDVGSTRGAAVLDEVTLTASKKGAGCSVTSTVRAAAGTVVAKGAKPGAVT